MRNPPVQYCQVCLNLQRNYVGRVWDPWRGVWSAVRYPVKLQLRTDVKTIDYVVGGVGAQRTITARTDRAKSRTPEPISFNDNASALKFVKAANAEGYRFSGQELLDPDYRLEAISKPSVAH